MNIINDEGIIRLTHAIIERAAEDYVESYFTIHKLGLNPIDKYCGVEHLESFFHSQYFTLLTDIDPDILITKLRDRAMNG